MAPARVRRTVDLGRVEDCLKLLSMRASFNASLAHPAHTCDARRVHVRIRKYGSSLAARWCAYRNKGLNVRGGTLGIFAASAAATVGFALQGERLIDPSISVSPDAWRTDRGRLESPGRQSGWSLAAARQPGLGTAPV